MSSPSTYFDVAAEIALGACQSGDLPMTGESAAELRTALARSVSSHLISDVPVGVFLSAGIDSTAIASLARDSHPEGSLRTITVAFDEYRGTPLDEAVLAERAAAIIGSDQRTIRVTARDFADQLRHALAAMDQPTIDGLNTYFVVKAARECGVKVVLSGVGGDELFGGYAYYRRIPRLMRWLGATAAVPGVGKAVRMLGRPLADLLGKPKAASVVEMAGDATTAYMLYRCLMLPWELPQVMDADEVHQGMQELAVFEAMRRGVAGVSDVSLQICALDFQWYLRNQLLRDSDWASMAHSVELRTPLVDAELLRDIMRLRAAGYLPSKTDFCEAVNPQIHALLKDRPKTGFSIPVAQWMPAKLRASAHRANPYRAWARYVFGAVQ